MNAQTKPIELARYQITIPIDQLGAVEDFFAKHEVRILHRMFLGYGGIRHVKLNQEQRLAVVASTDTVAVLAETYQVSLQTIYRIRKGCPGSAPEPE